MIFCQHPAIISVWCEVRRQQWRCPLHLWPHPPVPSGGGCGSGQHPDLCTGEVITSEVTATVWSNYSQEVVALTGKGSHISSLALNPTRNLIAFTEFGDRPLLVVYDLENRKKLKLLRCAEFKSHDVVSIAFSHDSKYILVQGGQPDFQLVYFFWEKGKVITSITR